MSFESRNLKLYDPFRPHVPLDIATSGGVPIEISSHQTQNLAVLVDPCKDRVVDLINELILSYLERVVLPSLSFRTPSRIADALLGKPTAGKLPIVYCHCCLIQSDAQPIPNFEVDYVSRKVKHFLGSHVTGQPVIIEEESQWNFLSHRRFDLGRPRRWPAMLHVYGDQELYDVFQYSTVLGNGRE
ncbi:hypothetical protein BDV32DRAFT_153739 [Aspergillus pseudonomiae]|uniref:Uncharacterized protein n=1 Tax=Aspergillus pseudonomiae TaxID=1506151 RepID=A0A5N7DJ53_9EURO|nr:uncharacterized protein BDV37DRAFT_280751 [Aspergillus pseudonomiae]KAB8255995.1 hypothetical protein BDV32DRAFT_153739 [Aspergillus pseudonomiae]KAE8406470.1 hypothetical protein BDV37DRAFT_280751 [Aspergillus pseudonomiae]